jgi:hypothetical protein
MAPGSPQARAEVLGGRGALRKRDERRSRSSPKLTGYLKADKSSPGYATFGTNNLGPGFEPVVIEQPLQRT